MLCVCVTSPSDKHIDPPSFMSSPRSGVRSRSSSGLSDPGDSFPGDEVVNTAGPPVGGGISIPIRRYFLRLLLIHVCQSQRDGKEKESVTAVDNNLLYYYD